MNKYIKIKVFNLNKNSLQKGALRTDTQKSIVDSTTKLAGGLTKDEQKIVAESTKNQGDSSQNEDVTKAQGDLKTQNKNKKCRHKSDFE